MDRAGAAQRSARRKPAWPRGADTLMETRSNHILVGGVVLGLLALLVVFILWIAQISGGHEQKYDIFFKSSVEGLAKGSTVTFNGVPTGKIEEIALLPSAPQFVRVRISVDEKTPILQGTTATIAGVGFTGVSQINLDGAMQGAPPIDEPGPNGVPVIPTKPGALGELLNSAPQLLQNLSALTDRLTMLLSDRNQASITGILANTQKISKALADRSPEIASTLADAHVAIHQAGDAAEQFGKLAGTVNADAGPLLKNLNHTIAQADQTLSSLNTVLSEARPGVQAFSKTTVPEVGQLVKDLRAMTDSLGAVAAKIDQNPASALLGGRKLPDYNPHGR
jgi:phospholipid/cholesterol/gamma-HCH transport system substrate-binding protein